MTRLQQSHLDATCPVYYCCGTAKTNPVSASLLWGDQRYHGWSQVPLLLPPHPVQGEFVSHGDTAAAAVQNAFQCKCNVLPSFLRMLPHSTVLEKVRLAVWSSPWKYSHQGSALKSKLWREFSWPAFLFLPTLNLCPSDNHKIQAFPVQTSWN